MVKKYLEGDRIRLEKFCSKHITDEYISWLNDFEINKHLCVGRIPVSKEYISEITDGIRFAIIVRGDEYIGTITLHRVDWIIRRAEIGYLIGNKKFWGKGVTSEAINIVTDYAFNRLGLNKIVAKTVEGNIGSEKVLEKNGYRKYGVEPQEYWLEGKFLDLNLYYILSEWGLYGK